jgi:RNA polymerase sigma-70 factor (ECF subfamily)
MHTGTDQPRGGVDERTLIQRALTGDPDAERALYDAHVDRIYRLAYRMTGEDDLAQDCTQDTFIRAFDRLAEFRGDAAFGTWLHTIATSVVLNALRKVKRFRKRETDLEVADTVATEPRRAEPDLKTRLREAINGLPTKYRMVFVMHDVEGYTHQQIADAVGIQVGTSKAQLFRAREKLRAALAEFAGEWAV